MYSQVKKHENNSFSEDGSSFIEDETSFSEDESSFIEEEYVHTYEDDMDAEIPKEEKTNLNRYHKVTEHNIDIIIEEVKEFIHLYLFKGDINSSLEIKIENLFDISDDDLITLKAVHFFLSEEVRDLIEVLPYLLRNLSHSTHKEIEEYQGIIRGRIDWNATLKTRYAKGFDDKSLFVCSPATKFYNLEENQLLKFLLKKILSLRDNYLGFVNLNTDNFDFELLSQEKDWYNIVANNYKMTKWALKKVYFDDIDDLKQVKAKHLRKALKNRNLIYHRVAKAYILFEDLFINDDEDVLIDLVERRLIRAANPDKLYEIYVFFNLIKTLPDVNLRLLHGGNDYSMCSILEDGTKVTIHYQYTPKALKKVSEYIEILKNYEIKGSTRAPDCIVEFEKDNKKYYRLVEVKNTSSENYVRESVYKVMGYYRDFERVKDLEGFDFTDKYPVVLVTWGGIAIKDNYNPFNDKIVILNRKEFIGNLEKLVKF